MKLLLTKREQLASLGQFLVDELDSLVARIRASWNIEHTADGRHAHVNAESVASGRVVYSDIISDSITNTDAQVNNYDPAGLSTAALLRIDTTHDVATITGLRVPQDEGGVVLDGRVLVIENISTTATLRLSSEHTSSSPRNRIVLPWVPSDANNAFMLLMPGSLTTLIYNASKARWIVASQSNAQIVGYTEFGSNQNDYAPTGFRSARTYRLVATAASLTISGFSAEDVPYPSSKTLVNDGLYAIAILHQNTGSTAANRVSCPGGVRYRLHPRESVELFKNRDGNWQLVQKADQWADVTFAAGNFTTDVGTWTVASGDQTTYAYQLDGNKMTVSFDLATTTVATNPTQLRIAVPNGRTIARDMSNNVQALNNGVQVSTAYVQATAGNTYLQVFLDLAGTAWATATDNTRVKGQITFMVRDDCASISELHTDVSHGDQSHLDADHLDTHSDTPAHSDSHTDTPHADGSHADTHDDIAFVDSHADTHDDTAHADSHSDTAHDDDHGDHADAPVDPHIDFHFDVPHDDSHNDTAHSDSHDDTHDDVEHEDSHADTGHSDTPHVDNHGDTAPHSDSHSDSGHADTEHLDSVHADVGQHCDTSHVDI